MSVSRLDTQGARVESMSTSARKENRWRKTVYAANDQNDKSKREIEAATMVRGVRLSPVSPVPNATRKEVRSWMRRNATEYGDSTHLAEAANVALELPAGAMDDGDHWVWEEAYLASKIAERE